MSVWSKHKPQTINEIFFDILETCEKVLFYTLECEIQIYILEKLLIKSQNNETVNYSSLLLDSEKRIDRLARLIFWTVIKNADVEHV